MKTIILLPLLLIYSCLVNLASGCECQPEKPESAYCRAHWVAHVRINAKVGDQKMPKGMVDRQIFRNSRYDIKYIKLFKVSENMPTKDSKLVIMPVNVYSATEDAACGIELEPAHEYLLSGRYINGTMLTQLCGQILLDDLVESRKHDILEWSEVPKKLLENLEKQNFDKRCKELE